MHAVPQICPVISCHCPFVYVTVFAWSFPVLSYGEDLSIIQHSSQVKSLLKCIMELSCRSCLYIFEISCVSVASFAIIFSHSEGCLFTLLIVSFDVQKLLRLIRSHLFIFAFISNCLYFQHAKSKMKWPWWKTESLRRLSLLRSSLRSFCW